MLKIGITGGIGSGKTTVCKIFELLGIPVYYADERAKRLMVTDQGLRAGIETLFGHQAYLDSEELNRKLIGQIVFNDPTKLAELNALVHPVVAKDALHWHSRRQNVPYTLKEAALLFESGSFRDLDKIIVVYAPQDLRIDRVMRRDGVDEASVRARMNRQMPDEEKVRRADFVIQNDNQHLLIPQVLEIHGKLIAARS